MQAVEESHTCEETKVMENKNIRRFASNTYQVNIRRHPPTEDTPAIIHLEMDFETEAKRLGVSVDGLKKAYEDTLNEEVWLNDTLMGRRTASQTAQVHSGKPNAEQAAWNAEVERKKQLKKEGKK